MADVRLAEVLSALSLAGDLGEGHPLEHTLRTTYLACRLAEHVGLDEPTRHDVLYVGLLRLVGCVAVAHEIGRLLATDDVAFTKDMSRAAFLGRPDQLRVVFAHAGAALPALRRPGALARAFASGDSSRGLTREQCEVGVLIGRRAGLGDGVDAALRAVFERWDGQGRPEGLRGRAIPLVARVVQLAAGAEAFIEAHGEARALAMLRENSGRALDPELTAAVLDLAGWRPLLAERDSATLWEDVLALEPPQARVRVPEERLDDLASAFADFADIKSPFFVGHSRDVATFAEAAARSLALSDTQCVAIRRAALLHDVGRASVPNTILDKPGPLTPGEREVVRLHAYYAERILARAPAFAPYAAVAGAHHERLDGSGYPRGAKRPDLPIAARILAAADTFCALCEARAHRPARTPQLAAAALREEARAGRLDHEVVESLLAAALGDQARRPRASGTLTERELEVLGLLAQGCSNREIARRLVISENTARHHLESVYAKLEVRTRTGAIVRALERGLL